MLGLFSVVIWNHHLNIRLDDPIIRGLDLYTINRALDIRLDDPRDALKNRVSNHTWVNSSWEYCIRFSGALKTSDELRSDLASDSSRDLIHPGERSLIL